MAEMARVATWAKEMGAGETDEAAAVREWWVAAEGAMVVGLAVAAPAETAVAASARARAAAALERVGLAGHHGTQHRAPAVRAA